MGPAATDLSAARRAVPAGFDRIARWYDTLAAISPGYARHLRLSARRLALPPGARILDLCCGTGLSTAALRAVYPTAALDGLDASPEMLARARRRGLPAPARFVLGDAMDPAAAGLPGPYDGVLMAYGIRNVPDADGALRQLRRVLRPGGTVCFHEFSVADSRRARLLWNALLFGVVIPYGALTTPGSGLYRYLRRSVLAFDGVRAFEERLRRAGFDDVRTEPMDLWARGIVHSFLARRPG